VDYVQYVCGEEGSMMLNYDFVSDTVKESLARYVKHRIPTGGFLQAVLENNLKEACGRADDQNQATLFHIVSYIYNELPFNCWGSPERVRQWLVVASSQQQSREDDQGAKRQAAEPE